MRISTRQIYTQGIEAFQQQQQKLAQLQHQISSGVRLNKPSDDPAAASRVLELEQDVSVNLQYQANINLAEQRLVQQDSVMKSYANLLNRVRELAIQGNNGPLDPASRNAIAGELDQRLSELYSLTNTTDANGDYLFAGFQNANLPFTPATTGSIDHVSFNGDAGTRSIQISKVRLSKVRQMEIDTSGRSIFMEIPSAAALREIPAAANTGSAVIAPASVVDSSIHVPGDYEIRFVAPGLYDVFDVAGGINIVTGATYSDSQDISFQGIQTSITGVPAAGDVFTVSSAQYQDVFGIVSNLAETLRNAPSDAVRAANIAQSLVDIDAALDVSLNFRTLDVSLNFRTTIGGKLTWFNRLIPPS